MEARTPEEYLAQLDEPRRGEIKALHDLISETLPDLEPHVASGMLAYGTFHYRYASGREGDSSLVALASRKQYISIYVLCSVDGEYLAERYVDRLPNANIGKSCVRFRRNSDVDLGVVRELIAEAGSRPAASGGLRALAGATDRDRGDRSARGLGRGRARRRSDRNDGG